MMDRDIESKLNLIISQIVELKSELNRLRGLNLEHHLGTPASVEDVNAVERLTGFPLPHDYRTFLLMHNGWTGMRGQNDLLSTCQILSDTTRTAIQRIKDLQAESADPAVSGFVIEASPSDTDIAYFDPSSRRANGDMDVVRWDAQAGEYQRYATFTGYLIGFVNSLERRIASEKNRLR